ncbi:hypothetical protein [Pelagibacterium lacus]|uniref:Dynamin n=1 Tax=Pelagibacterium lacus TaxID=2282655 RepID=A0A369W6V9_9HYPH|nr:hypothetical protein [Pelagibacterium lacus]RDE09070.1 hypothetical protein DVH29_07715 [Pelagibacterium lacus]
MTDPDPHLNKTEMRQGNSRKENSRALIYGLIAIVILFALAIWYFTANSDQTATTTDGGATIENSDAVESPAEDALDELPTPAPVPETETAPPVVDVPAVEAPAAEPPAAEEPAAETPAVEPPAAEEPAPEADTPPVTTP